jgi:hypothetical protein
VAVNADDGSIELQYFDGTIEEVELGDWLAMRAKQTDPPEDWSGSVDVNNEDLPDDRFFSHQDWQAEVDALDDGDLSISDLTGIELNTNDLRDQEHDLERDQE